MRKYLLLLSGLLTLQTASSAFAGDLGINVILSGEVSPGVYGQVQIGNAPRPVLVYDQPRVIVVDRRYERDEPIYLHVPPGHSMHWDKHCQAYNACGRRVYFVKSREYEPEYQREHDHHDHDDDHERKNKNKNKGHGKDKH
jgi:hypothetical protein